MFFVHVKDEVIGVEISADDGVDDVLNRLSIDIDKRCIHSIYVGDKLDKNKSIVEQRISKRITRYNIQRK